MPKAEWGVKRTCPNCETRFYDLQREPILCPECGATFNMDSQGKVSGMRERRVPVAAAAAADPLVEDDEALVDDEEDEESVEDPLLADDEDEDEPAGPALADEEDEQAAVPFKDATLVDDEDELDEDEEEDDDEEDEFDDLDDASVKNKGD